MELFEASRQWANRPPDERRSDLRDLYVSCLDYFRRSSEAEGVLLKDLHVEAIALPGRGYDEPNDDLVLVDGGGTKAGFSNWSFKQLCQRVGAAASYLATLPADIVSLCINHGLQHTEGNGSGDAKANLLIQTLRNNRAILMAATSDKYARIWNWEIADRLLRLDLKGEGWRVPPARPAPDGHPGARPATEADLLSDVHGLSINLGDMIAPAGIYNSDHDLFAFLINEHARIADGSDEGMSRGFFVSNSEVGAAAFRVTRFLYRHVCGNHIVWGASNVTELKVRHVGNAPDRAWGELEGELKCYAEDSASDEEAMIAHAQTKSLGSNKDEILDRLFGLEVASRKALGAAYDSSEALFPEDGDPRTVWGMAQGLSRVSQAEPFGEDRVALDRAAGEVMKLAGD